MKKVHIKSIGIMILAIVVCILIPAIIKFTIFTPLVSLLTDNVDLVKLIVAPLTTIVLVLTYYFFFKYFEKRKVAEVNLSKLPQAILYGFFFGFGLISLVVITLYTMNCYTIIDINRLSMLIKPLMLFIVMGVLEEIIFRGIIYRILENMLGTIFALIISSLLFGFVHFSNPGFNIFSGLTIALELGLLTGIIYSSTRNIWCPIFLHIGWNFSFVFYGVTVSGANDFTSFIESNISGYSIFTGGEFGPENSVITIIYSLIAFAMLFQFGRKKGSFISRLATSSKIKIN